MFLICFSIVDRSSYEWVEDKCIQEVRRRRPNTPYILVGTQLDLRSDKNEIARLAKSKQKLITKEEGLKLARRIGALRYYECSALTQKGLKQVFNNVILAGK